MVQVSRKGGRGAVIYSLVFERSDLAAKLNPSKFCHNTR